MKLWISVLGILALVVLCSASVLASDTNDVTIGANVLNSAPSVDVELTPDDDPATPGVQVINLDPSTNKTVTIVANASDKNGYDHIVSVTAKITGPSIVPDSPVDLTFDTVINTTTATYTGSFNMSNHSKGNYKVKVTATDAGGLAGIGSRDFTYSYSYGILYAIWTNSTTHKHAIQWSGSRNMVNGNIHSNNDIKVSGTSNMIIGTTEYVSTFTDSGSNNTYIPPPIKVSPEPFPIQYNIADYKPGGKEAIAAEDKYKYHHIEGNFHISGSDVVLDGLYYVEGNVKLSGSNISGVFTIVTEKKIDVGGSTHNCSAYSGNLLFLSNSTKIKIAGSESDFSGIICAPKGEIDLSGSGNTINGGLFADTVKLSGSESNININAAYRKSTVETTQASGDNINIFIKALKAISQIFIHINSSDFYTSYY